VIVISVLKHIIKYNEQGIAKTMQIRTFDIEVYIQNLTARRKQIKIIGYETV